LRRLVARMINHYAGEAAGQPESQPGMSSIALLASR
jgi:hypothetical protein